MPRYFRVQGIFLAALLSLAGGGCSSAYLNPAVPRAKTGYVDFYTDSSFGLSWEVKRAHEVTGEMRRVFYQFKPVEGTILRLAAPPGTHRFQVWFNNEVTEGPRTVSVEVVDGKVTPVHVTLTPKGSVSVESRDYEYRPAGRTTRRVTKVGADPNVVYRIGAQPGAPVAYQFKEQMPYWAGTEL